jgi:hypothetical protein
LDLVLVLVLYLATGSSRAPETGELYWSTE